MPVPLEKFVKQLEDSGILAGDTVKDFIPPKATPKDAEELARELVRKKKLTKFQAEEVSKGKGKSLVLGNYVLMEQIGAGGMGQVFKAEHRRMHRTVAIKMLPPNVTKDAAAIARFEREVTAAAKLRHPNIVAADDADCANGVHFLVMEMVEGSDLSALVKKNGPFPIENAVNYVLQAAKGLEYAHSKGVVHRDIKPANLLLGKDGILKILDMGLARIEGAAAGQAELTGTGAVMGTVDYMPPEQALNTKTADARADIYSLGCSFFYLLSGKATYDGDNLLAKLLAHRDQPIPDLRAACPQVPESLDAVFKKMVAKKIEDRYQTMTEVIADLERSTSGQSSSVSVPQETRFNLEDSALSFLKNIPVTPTTQKTRAKAKPKAVAATTERGEQPPWKNPKVLIGGGILGVLILLAGIVISLTSDEGTLVVTVDQPDAMVQVLDADGKIEVGQKGGKGKVTISVDPGKHRLKVEKDGFAVFGQEFEMESGGKKTITAKLEPLEVKPIVVEADQTKGVDAAPKDDGGGWVSLFNGKNLDGWKPQPGDLAKWEVKDGVLVGGGPNAGHLFTQRDDYINFHFRVEAKISDLGNSGQYFRAKFASGFPLGYEAQINSTRPDLKTGSLYGLAPVTEMLVKADEWFTQEVIADGNHITILVNGKKVVDYLDGENRFTKGHFALQHNPARGGIGTAVEFRKIDVKELPNRTATTSQTTSAPPLSKTTTTPSTTTDNIPPSGFTALFNGKDLSGWKGIVPIKKRTELSAGDLEQEQSAADKKVLPHWTVREGVLHYDGMGDSLQSAQDFGDFELYIDWKIGPNGDSGIYLRGVPQVQIWDNPAGSGGLYNNEKSPGTPLQVADNPVGEWNTFYIVMVGAKVTISLNNVLVVDDTTLENYWDRSIPIPAAGPIELQHHASPLEFKNIFLKKL